MATAKIISGEKPYYTIRVECSGDRVFDQNIFCEKENKELEKFLQSYADDYEAGLPPVESE